MRDRHDIDIEGALSDRMEDEKIHLVDPNTEYQLGELVWSLCGEDLSAYEGGLDPRDEPYVCAKCSEAHRRACG